MSRRRPSRAEEAANRWVTRTPSGLPLCPTCRKELGFCPHSPMFRRDGSRSSGVASMLGITNSAVMALNARERTAQVDQRQMPPPHGGTKRRSTQEKAEASRKGRRREGSHEKVSSSVRETEYCQRCVLCFVRVGQRFWLMESVSRSCKVSRTNKRERDRERGITTAMGAPGPSVLLILVGRTTARLYSRFTDLPRQAVGHASAEPSIVPTRAVVSDGRTRRRYLPITYELFVRFPIALTATLAR